MTVSAPNISTAPTVIGSPREYNEERLSVDLRPTVSFPDLDVLFAGAGTTGTPMGCARYFRRFRPLVRVVAVDAVGSVIFEGPSGPRMIPGLGAAQCLPMLDESWVGDVVRVAEAQTLSTCHRLAWCRFLSGGSTGTVVAGATRWLAAHAGPDTVSVAIAPDRGERYLDTVYRTNWVESIYGGDVLHSVLAASSDDAYSRWESA